MDYKDEIYDTISDEIEEYLQKNEGRIDKAFYEYFDIFNQFKLDGKPYILGGFLRDTLIKKKPKDLDMVILNGNKPNILDNIKRLKLEYTLNAFGDYKISYNNKEIDIWTVKNLIEAIEFNIDGLFYDIQEKRFVDIGFIDAMDKNSVIRINKINHPYMYCEDDWITKILKDIELLKNIINEQTKDKNIEINR